MCPSIYLLLSNSCQMFLLGIVLFQKKEDVSNLVPLVIVGSDLNKYLPGPHYDPPSKERLKALIEVTIIFPPSHFDLFITTSLVNWISCSSAMSSTESKAILVSGAFGSVDMCRAVYFSHLYSSIYELVLLCTLLLISIVYNSELHQPDMY